MCRGSMLTGLKRIYLKITGTIRKKLIICFMLIIFILILAYAYTLVSDNELIDLYKDTLETHLLFNNLFVNLGTVNEDLQKYLESGSAQAYKNYETLCPILQASSNNLIGIFNDDKFIRETIDLKYMIKSYLEEADKAIDLRNAEKTTESNARFYAAQSTFKLINENFQNVYSIILENTNSLNIQINKNRDLQFTYNCILFIIGGIICVILVQWFSGNVTKPIKKLTNVALEVSKGDMRLVETPITTHDEVSILTLAFNKMLRKIDQQISEITEKAELEKKLNSEEMENLKIKSLLKESELKALQSRINPHFLFNSINIISQLAYIENSEQTYTLLNYLGDFLRYNLDKFNKFVTIEDEMRNIKDYIFIQKKRFGSRVDFIIEDDQDARSSIIPCLTIQPLVENAIIHGVESYLKNGIIGVEVIKKKSRVKIKVYDNGIGFEEGNLQCVRKMIESDEIDSDATGIGLQNVFARLKLFFNNDIGINITSKSGEKTEITLDLPYRIQRG
jgi:sensor histidine kinase YesM